MKSLKKLLLGLLPLLALTFMACPPTASTPENVEVASVTFSPDTETIKPGATVNLASTTEGAEIYWSKTAELTSQNFTEGTNTSTVTITNDVNTKSETIYAIAVFTSSSGNTFYSQSSSKTYTIAQVPTAVTFDPAAGSVTSGQKVKLSATSPVEGDTVTIYYSTTTALTENNYATAGTVYDQTGDGIEITGACNIYAIAVGQNGTGAASSASYTLPVALMSTAPQADDVVYIYYPANKYVMLSTANPNKLRYSDEITLDSNNSFTPTSDMASLTVFKNDIDQYVFVSNGKYLTAGATGNSLTLSDTFTYLALWDVVATSDGANTFYINNANAIFGSNRQGLEFYSGFTVYNRNTKNIYQFQFFKDPNKTSELNEQAKASLAVAANALEEPKFSVEAGEVVTGTITKLSSASLDAEFWYTTDSSKADKEHLTEMTKYDDTKGIEITGKEGDSVTYYALAGRLKNSSSEASTEGVFSTAVASVTYTIGKDTNTYIEKATSLTENDVVAIYYPEGTSIISGTVSGTGFAATSATVTSNGMVTKKGDVSENLTFFTVKEYESGDYVFIGDGKYLTSGPTGSSLTLSESLTRYALWNLEKVNADQDDGNFFIKNKNATYNSNAQYIQFDNRTGYNRFTVYTMNNNTQQFTYQFYKATDVQADSAQAKVMTPEFSIASGTAVVTDTPIVITSDTTTADIYWKWKADSDEDLSSTNYTSDGVTKYSATEENGEPIVNDESVGKTLQAIAKDGENFSNVVSATYTIDNQPTETLTFSSMGYTNSQSISSIDGTNVTLTLDKGSNNNDPKYYNAGTALRFYANNTMTATTKNSKKLTKIEINFQSNYVDDKLASDSGAVSTSGTTVTWTATDIAGVDSVVFTWSKTCRTQSMKFFYAE